MWDHEAYLTDTTYMASDPVMGEDAYSKAAADWQKKRSNSLLNNIAIAYPFEAFSRDFVVSAAYHNTYQINDYDRNDTYLDPHPESNIYNEIPERVVAATDTLHINWSQYARQRFCQLL